MNKVYQHRTHVTEVSIRPAGDQFQVVVGNKTCTIAAQQLGPGHFLLETEGRQMQLYTAKNDLRRYVAMDGKTWVLEQVVRSKRSEPQRGGHDSLAASMPGMVLEICVKVGDMVERGQTLVLLEAMKMELRVTAPQAGKVGQVHCRTGQVVERGQILIELDTEFG